jgi:hypothetical protein
VHFAEEAQSIGRRFATGWEENLCITGLLLEFVNNWEPAADVLIKAEGNITTK